MRRISFRLRSGLVACFFAGLAGIACTQGLGGRCVQNSDCSSGMCSSTGQTTEGGRCVAPGSTIVPTPGTGGTAGHGGAGGAAGVTGLGGAAGATGVGGAAGASGGQGGSTAGVTGNVGHDGGAADATADH